MRLNVEDSLTIANWLTRAFHLAVDYDPKGGWITEADVANLRTCYDFSPLRLAPRGVLVDFNDDMLHVCFGDDWYMSIRTSGRHKAFKERMKITTDNDVLHAVEQWVQTRKKVDKRERLLDI